MSAIPDEVWSKALAYCLDSDPAFIANGLDELLDARRTFERNHWATLNRGGECVMVFILPEGFEVWMGDAIVRRWSASELAPSPSAEAVRLENIASELSCAEKWFEHKSITLAGIPNGDPRYPHRIAELDTLAAEIDKLKAELGIQ